MKMSYLTQGKTEVFIEMTTHAPIGLMIQILTSLQHALVHHNQKMKRGLAVVTLVMVASIHHTECIA